MIIKYKNKSHFLLNMDFIDFLKIHSEIDNDFIDEYLIIINNNNLFIVNLENIAFFRNTVTY